jgi:ribosome maturation factor RimP
MGFGPIFCLCASVATVAKAVQQVLETTAKGLGYELVDFELANRGRLLRVFIERPGHVPVPGRPDGVTLEDCERVSRQLQHVLPVEGIDYDRLEVSSPGLDRVLKRPEEFRRFAGFEAEVRLRLPENGRRKFTGVLRGADDAALSIEVAGALRTFPFTNLEKARLVPKL